MTDERSPRMSSVLGETGIVIGNVDGNGDLEIRGRVQGSITLSGRVFVAESGVVLGNVEATNITVAGEVRGDLAASDGVEVHALGRVEGSIEAPRVGIEAGARVLDVGCGAGALGAALRRERDIEVVGIELAPTAVERASERLDRVIAADLDALEALPADAGVFDAIVLADVLEHLRDPARLVRALRPALTAGAPLVMSVPNVKHWSVIEPLLVHDRFPYADAGLLDRTHVHLFTLEELGLMLLAEGYALAEVRLVTDPLPDRLRVLAEVAGALGGVVEETAARLGVYQYLVSAPAV